MPNWAENIVEIVGSKKDIASLKKFVGDKLDFEKLVPVPKKHKDNIDWYNEHWGTEWDIADGHFKVAWQKNMVNMYFWTAWTPPEGIYKALVKKFPNLKIRWHYNENGNCFSGNFETREEFGYPDCECGKCEDCTERWWNKD